MATQLPPGGALEILDTGPLAWRRLMAFSKHRAETGALGWMDTHALLWTISHCVVVLCAAALIASAAYLSAVLVPLLAAVLLSFALLPAVHLLERRPPVFRGRARCQRHCTPRPRGQRLPGCGAAGSACTESARLLQLPHVANVAIALGLVLAAGRATVSGVWSEVALFVKDDKARIDDSFTAALQGGLLALLDPARNAEAEKLLAAPTSWRLACVLPDGQRVEPWTPDAHTAGNEGCLVHRTGVPCACAGTLFRVEADGTEVRLETYGYLNPSSPPAVGLSEFILARARQCIWTASVEQVALGGEGDGASAAAVGDGQGEQSLSEWWGGQAPAVLESAAGVLVLVSLLLWIDIPATLASQQQPPQAAATRTSSADSDLSDGSGGGGAQGAHVHGQGRRQLSLSVAAGVIQTYGIIRLAGAAWLGASTWLILQLCAAALGAAALVLPLSLTVLNMALHFMHPTLGTVWWLTLAVTPLIVFDPAISHGSGIVVLVLLTLPHAVSHTLLVPWLWRSEMCRQAAEAVGGSPRPVASIVFIVLLGRGLSSALALWLAVPLLLLCKLTLCHIEHPVATFLATQWL